MAAYRKSTRPTLSPGTVLENRFEIRELLGRGAFGAVYRAAQLVFGEPLREVALKLFETDKVNPDNVRTVFQDAVMVLGLQERSPHPDAAQRMIQVYDIGVLRTSPPRAFMSMKLVAGGRTLETEARRWRTARMPLESALDLFRQMLIPLAWMHTLDMPVVHGDLKPDNVLLSEDGGTAIVTDFGLASHLPAGSMGGAIEYQAPECLAGMTGDESSDVYSAGLILYELLTGCHLFDGVGLQATADGDDAAYVQAHLEARRRPIRKYDPDDQSPRIRPASEIHKELRGHPQIEVLLNRCLAYRASERPGNARVLLDALDRYAKTGAGTGFHAVGPATATPGPAAPAILTAERLLEDARMLVANRPDEALAKAAEASKLEPRNIPALLMQVRIGQSLGRSNGLNLCDGAEDIAGNDAALLADVWEAKAELLNAAGRPERARFFLQRAAEKRAEARRRR